MISRIPGSSQRAKSHAATAKWSQDLCEDVFFAVNETLWTSLPEEACVPIMLSILVHPYVGKTFVFRFSKGDAVIVGESLDLTLLREVVGVRVKENCVGGRCLLYEIEAVVDTFVVQTMGGDLKATKGIRGFS
jgi:hypothetical protein